MVSITVGSFVSFGRLLSRGVAWHCLATVLVDLLDLVLIGRLADARLLVESFRAKVRLVHLVIHDVHLLVQVHHAHDLLVARYSHRTHRFLLRVRHRLVHSNRGRVSSTATTASSDRYDSTTANGSQSLNGKNSLLRVKFLHSVCR